MLNSEEVICQNAMFVSLHFSERSHSYDQSSHIGSFPKSCVKKEDRGEEFDTQPASVREKKKRYSNHSQFTILSRLCLYISEEWNGVCQMVDIMEMMTVMITCQSCVTRDN